MNELSSRSHTIFTIYVTQKISSTEYSSSTLSLIDLAGSERVKKSNSADTRLDEAKFINTSLSSLGNVISALAENNSEKFVPYRTSKLTRILKNSLTGKSRISVICTLEISTENMYETYSTLLFADRCKEIRFPNQPVINIETFEEIDQEKDIKAALERSLQKEKEYQEIIRQM
jgi:kinesin family member 5